MSNAKRRHRRRRRRDLTFWRWKARMEKQGLWGFDRCFSWRWTDEQGKPQFGHILRGGFGYF